MSYTREDFFAGKIGCRCDTKDEYDQLMRECEAKGLRWGSGQTIAAERDANFRPGASYTLGDPHRKQYLRHCFPPCDCGRDTSCGHRNSIPFSTLFLDPWAEFVAGKCYLRITEDEWPEFARRCDAAGVEWQCNVGKVAGFLPIFEPYALIAIGAGRTIMQNPRRNPDPTDRPIHPFSAIARPEAEAKKPEYKVGDLWEVTQNNPVITDLKRGDIVSIVRVFDKGMSPTVRNIKTGKTWSLGDYAMKHYAAPPTFPRIEITTDGRVTTATLYEGEKAVKTATATCSPEDTFDLFEGAALAYNRLRFGQQFQRTKFAEFHALSRKIKALGAEIEKVVGKL